MFLPYLYSMSSKQWFNKAVIYHVFIDRFNGFKSTNNHNGFIGGNISGVIERLDYIKHLGVNAIWLSPFYETSAYHGYHITDFKKVEPRFGTLHDLKILIAEANKLKIEIIADFVPNHCSKYHPFFTDAYNNPSSKYYKWFIWDKKEDYLSFLDFKELPKLNLRNKETREYMIDVAKHWLSLGISGFRIDHVIGPPHTFWNEFHKQISKAYPNAVLFGEAWACGINTKHFKTLGIKNKAERRRIGVLQEDIQLEYYGKMDGALDFVMNWILTEAVHKRRKLLTGNEVKRKIKLHMANIPDDYKMVTFLDNHDMDRFLRHCRGKVHLLLEAFEVLLAMDNPVVIYNGTENCSYNKIPVCFSNPYSDLLVREPFDWDNINSEFVSGFKGLVKKYRS